MTDSGTSRNDLALETSIPAGAVPLESILCTEELQRRLSRPPNYEKENHALVALVSALADSPSTIFQALTETILDTTQCDSAGLSLLTRDGKTPDVYGKRFYWPAIAGGPLDRQIEAGDSDARSRISTSVEGRRELFGGGEHCARYRQHRARGCGPHDDHRPR
jgi:hypothetical protein